jgi:hypothetical protein
MKTHKNVMNSQHKDKKPKHRQKNTEKIFCQNICDEKNRAESALSPPPPVT